MTNQLNAYENIPMKGRVIKENNDTLDEIRLNLEPYAQQLFCDKPRNGTNVTTTNCSRRQSQKYV